MFLVILNYPRMAMTWTLIWICLGAFISTIPRIFFDIPYFMEIFDSDSLYKTFNLVTIYYFRSDQHIVSYVMGILCALVINKYRSIKLNGYLVFMLWVVTSLSSLLSQYWFSHFWLQDYDISYTEAILFLAFGKILFLIGYFWLFFACATNRGGWHRQLILFFRLEFSTLNLSFSFDQDHSIKF